MLVDHLIYAAPDPVRAADDFEERFGVRATVPAFVAYLSGPNGSKVCDDALASGIGRIRPSDRAARSGTAHRDR